MKNMNDLTAYCGLYCGDCIRYKSTYAPLARKLSDELKKAGFDRYAGVKSMHDERYRGYDEFDKYLLALVDLQCDNGCRDGGCPALNCEILQCCQEKGFEGCWECSTFENCDKFDFLKPFHGDGPVNNLKKIRELGLDKWLEQREKFYIWQ